MRRAVLAVVVTAGLVACAGSAPPRAESSAGAAKPVSVSKPAETAPVTPVVAASVPLPDRVDAGSLPRARVIEVLQQGAGRFLQKLKTEPHVESGRFIGWRIVRLFDHDPTMRGEILRPGDTLMRVNGQSIERPEEFLNVWQAIRTSGELVLSIRRAGHDSTVHYTIAD